MAATDKKELSVYKDGAKRPYFVKAENVNLGTKEEPEFLPDRLAEMEEDISDKVDKVTGKGLSSNDYTDTDKAKVDGLKPVATSGSYNDLTDKPTIPTVPTMDAAPTAGNTTHMVSSDGVAAAIDAAIAQAGGTVKTISVNGVQQPNNNGNVNITVEAGAQGPKGDTGNVQVDGNGNVLIVNNVDEGGTGAALSAEMGKRLALKSGTFAAAWARAQVIPVPFSFLWVENVSGVLVRKPIWHIGNSVFVDAAGGAVSVAASAVPNAPTFSETSGSVSSGAEITITPYTDSVLHYIVGGTEYTSVIPVTVVINQAQVVIEAWCENAAGSSSHLTQTYTANAPAAPVLSINGSQVTSNQIITRNTVVTITATEGTLHYKVNDGQTQNPSGLTATVTCSGDTTKIEAWTERDSLSSIHTVITFSVAKPNAPTVEGTTAGSTVVSRGGSVTIRGIAGGKLCYRVNDATPAVEVNPVSDSTPTATVSIATNLVNGQMKIEAWNVKDGETSDHTTETFTMAALAAPTLSPATGEEFPAGGGSVTISATDGDGIKYTTDGSDPTSSQTATVVAALSATVNVTSRTTVKAVAYDSYGTSAIVEGIYTVDVAKIKVTASAATAMILTPPNNGTAIQLNIAQGENEFEVDTALGGVTTFRTCKFGDSSNSGRTNITRIDFGGITINDPRTMFKDCSNLLECKNLFVNGPCAQTFYNCPNLATNVGDVLSVGGYMGYSDGFFQSLSLIMRKGTIDFSKLTKIGTQSSPANIDNVFAYLRPVKNDLMDVLDLSNSVAYIGSMNLTFFTCYALELIIGDFNVVANTSINNVFNAAKIQTLRCTSLTPPTVGTDWLTPFVQRATSQYGSAKILVPSAALEDYKAAAGWSNHASIIQGY